jgi:hypothetical protein
LFAEVYKEGIVDDSESARKIRDLIASLLNGIIDKTIKIKDLRNIFDLNQESLMYFSSTLEIGFQQDQFIKLKQVI